MSAECHCDWGMFTWSTLAQQQFSFEPNVYSDKTFKTTEDMNFHFCTLRMQNTLITPLISL